MVLRDLKHIIAGARLAIKRLNQTPIRYLLAGEQPQAGHYQNNFVNFENSEFFLPLRASNV
jgi:hypothetical protein